MRVRQALTAIGVAVAVFALPMAAQASTPASSQASSVAAVRAAFANVRKDNLLTSEGVNVGGKTFCSLFTLAAQQQVAKKLGTATCAAAYAKALASETPQSRALVKKEAPLFASFLAAELKSAPVVIHGNTATVELSKLNGAKLKGGGTISGEHNVTLVRINGRWVLPTFSVS
jgi:hypothetical protein